MISMLCLRLNYVFIMCCAESNGEFEYFAHFLLPELVLINEIEQRL